MEVLENLHIFPWQDNTANNCNTYFINCKKKILIDPGHAAFFENVSAALSRLSISLNQIDLVIVTHGHPDHMEAVQGFGRFRPLWGLHEREWTFVRETAGYHLPSGESTEFEPDILFHEGPLRVGDQDFFIYHTPGHSPGSLSLYWLQKKALFTGDVIFMQGLGRTDLPGGDSSRLKSSIRRLASLDSEVLLPGHGDVVQGRDHVAENFSAVEKNWFPYL
jgi:glyoxylase-like metal-dependent hydrolase (beta-lactamase superfamily II)